MMSKYNIFLSDSQTWPHFLFRSTRGMEQLERPEQESSTPFRDMPPYRYSSLTFPSVSSVPHHPRNGTEHGPIFKGKSGQETVAGTAGHRLLQVYPPHAPRGHHSPGLPNPFNPPSVPVSAGLTQFNLIMLTSSVWALSTVFRIPRPCEAAADKALPGGRDHPSLNP